MQIVDTLIKADKDFDLLIGHGVGEPPTPPANAWTSSSATCSVSSLPAAKPRRVVTLRTENKAADRRKWVSYGGVGKDLLFFLDQLAAKWHTGGARDRWGKPGPARMEQGHHGVIFLEEVLLSADGKGR